MGFFMSEKEKSTIRAVLKEKLNNNYIDFENISSVTLKGTVPAFRIETEEEFDPVMTNFLTEQDGWQHYETKTVQYKVPDGENYCFKIKYKSGRIIRRNFHESSPLTEKLLEYCNKHEPLYETQNTFNAESCSDYEAAVADFNRLQTICELNETSDDEDFIFATEIKMANLIMADEDKYRHLIYELLLFLLSTPEEGDILEKTDKDGFDYLQHSDLGTDAFVISEQNTDIDDDIVTSVNKARIRNNYRKAAIISTGNNISTSALPDVIVWDIKNLCSAYMSAVKKIVKNNT